MFTRRHYEAIAKVMQDLQPGQFDSLAFREQHARTVQELCRMFERDNAAFDRDCFMRACIPGANVKARTA